MSLSNFPIKLLIVDDSAIMRNLLKKLLSVPEIQIVDTAVNGKDAVEKNLKYSPDVILLDIEMPVMNGIDALKQIMQTQPTAVIMFSSLTQDGSKETMEALSNGAIDFVPKDASYYQTSGVREDLVKKIIELGTNKFLKNRLRIKYAPSTIKETKTDFKSTVSDTTQITGGVLSKPKYTTQRKRPLQSDIKIVCIGISTGGPVALQEIIPQLVPDYPVPILIVQHMPPLFTESLSKRLDQSSNIKVVEASDGEHLKPGTVYIAKGGYQMQVTKQNTLSVNQNYPNELFKPSVNVMVKSIVEVYKDKAVGVIMTGMGNDGQIGLTALNQAGGYVIAQEPDTCVVAGMPRAVIDNKIVHEIQPLSSIGITLNALFNK